MAVRSAQAEWKGDLKSGSGTFSTQSETVEGKYTFGTRFGEDAGTNPEELIAAAHASCYSMALSNILAEAGHPPTSVHTMARVRLDMLEGGPTVTRIDLVTRGVVPGIEAEAFAQHAESAKKGCPISRALGAVEISLDAELDD